MLRVIAEATQAQCARSNKAPLEEVTNQGAVKRAKQSREPDMSLSVLAVKIVAGPAALYSLKSVAAASLQDRTGPSCQTSDSQRKLSEQQSRLFKKKQRQHPTGSGSHRAVLKSALITISY